MKLRINSFGPVDVILNDHANQLDEAVGVEGGLGCEELEENAAERPDIGFVVIR